MNFQEKNAWVCGAAECLVYIPYFWVVLHNPMAFEGLFLVAVASLITILVGFHIANAIATSATQATGETTAPDELDRVIELRAAKLSGLVLTAIVVVWTMVALLGMPSLGAGEVVAKSVADGASSAGSAISMTQALFWVHLLFAGLVLANITYYAGVVIAYRRLANG